MKKNKIILVLSIIVFLLSVFMVSQLEIESNMEDMLPKDSESLQATQSFNQYFDSSEQLMIIVTADASYIKENSKQFHITAKEYLKKLAESLQGESYINSVLYKVNLDEIRPFEWLFLEDVIYDQFSNALSDNNFETINNIFRDLEDAPNKGLDEYFVSNTEHHYMMLIKPLVDQDNFMESREMLYEGLNNYFNELGKNIKFKNLEVGLTGGAFIQDLESDQIAFDSLLETMVVTVLLIMLVVIVFFGSLKLPALAMYPLLLGALLAGVFAYLMYGSINMFSVSFALLLMGLGIDFAVHILARYQEERNEGKTINQAIGISRKSTGSSIIIGALTTAIAFSAFSIAKFKAFEQMGIISAVGLICLCVVMLVLMPILIRLFDYKNNKVRSNKKFIWLEIVTDFNIKHGKYVGIIVILVIIGLFNSVKSTEIETDLSAIYPDDLPSLEWGAIVEDAFDHNINSLSLYLDDLDSLEKSVDELNERNDIKRVDSILDYMPTNQNEKLAVILRLDTLLTSYDMDLFSEYKLQLLTLDDLPKSIRDNYLGKDGKLRVEIVPNIDIYNQADYEALMTGIKDIVGRPPVGIPTIMNEITLLVKEDMIKISILCLTIVFIISRIVFNRMKLALLTILPLVLTLYTTLGILPLLNIEINVFSIAAFPLIIGIGIDSAIHLVHRLEDNSTLKLSRKVSNTGQAIILTALTSIIGFGSLANINHPGMSHLGLTVATGMTLSIIYTLSVIPIGYHTLNK